MALFISFEGGEGSGKSTQASRLVQKFERMGIPTLSIHEPGTTNLGAHIRSLIKRNSRRNETISRKAELFLFLAARAELVEKVLSKQIKDPRLVIVADRYADSTVAYQGYGRQLSRDVIHSVNRFVMDDVKPDITLLLDCPPAEGLNRVGRVQTGLFEMGVTGRLDEEGSRRFENEPLAFHRRVRDGYLDLTRSEPERWVIVDGMEDEDKVFDSVCKAVGRLEKFQDIIERLVSPGEIPAPPDASEPTLFSISGGSPV